MFECRDTATDPKFSVAEWEALSRFVRAEWFFRVWVIQEAREHTKVSVFCGAYSIPWNMIGLMSAWAWYRPLQLLYDDNPDWPPEAERRAIKNAFFIWDQMPGNGEVPDFLHVLEWARHFQATDSRDKVFAMLNHGIDDTYINSAPGMSAPSTSADQAHRSTHEHREATTSGHHLRSLVSRSC
jgi:hypothetical protein